MPAGRTCGGAQGSFRRRVVRFAVVRYAGVLRGTCPRQLGGGKRTDGRFQQMVASRRDLVGRRGRHRCNDGRQRRVCAAKATRLKGLDAAIRPASAWNRASGPGFAPTREV
jgi:hypothetical protein